MSRAVLNRLKRRKQQRKDKDIAYYFEQARLTHTEKFSYSRIEESLENLLSLIRDESISNKHSLFFEKFLDLYLLVYSSDHSGSRKVHPSSFRKDCLRKVYYDISNVPYSGKSTIDIGLQKIFDIGTFWHTYIQAYLKKSGVLIQSEVIVRSRSRYLDGRGDGLLLITSEKRLLEIKTMSSYQFGKLRQPLDDHKFQATIYAKRLGLKKIHFVYVEKNFGKFKEFVIRPDVAMHKEAEGKFEKLTTYKRAKVSPPRECDKPSDGKKKNCPFVNHCFKVDIHHA